MFTYGTMFGRKKRQIEGPDFECTSFENCGNHSFVGVEFSDLDITDEQIDFCNNDTTCIFDLAVTGDEELADVSKESNENSTILQTIISKLDMLHKILKHNYLLSWFLQATHLQISQLMMPSLL